MPKTLPVLEPAPRSASPSGETCCTPSLVAAPISAADAEQLALRLKAIADPTRLRLLSRMLASENLEACTCDLTAELGLSQPTISHHLKKLGAAGLVTAERRTGTWTYYRVVPEALTGLASGIAPAELGRS